MTRNEAKARLTRAGHTNLTLRRTRAGVFQIIQPIYGNPQGRIDGEGSSWNEAIQRFNLRPPERP